MSGYNQHWQYHSPTVTVPAGGFIEFLLIPFALTGSENTGKKKPGSLTYY